MTERVAWNGLEELREALQCFLLRYCCDENEVEDVIQETFLRAARYRARIEPRLLRPWTTRVALNVLADFRRRTCRFVNGRAVEGALEGLEAHESPIALDDRELRLGGWVVKRGEALDHLADALTTLRPAERRVLGSFYGGAQSSRETAVECKIPPHLVKIRLFRARRRLLSLINRRLAAQGSARAVQV